MEIREHDTGGRTCATLVGLGDVLLVPDLKNLVPQEELQEALGEEVTLVDHRRRMLRGNSKIASEETDLRLHYSNTPIPTQSACEILSELRDRNHLEENGKTTSPRRVQKRNAESLNKRK